MKRLKTIYTRLRALFQRQKLDAQMGDEMRSHIEMQTQENLDAGMKPEDARYAALRQFGWVESVKDTCREQRGVTWLENLGQDIRYGARMLRKNLGFTFVAALTLALGIGANTAIFSLVNAVLLRGLPFPRHEQLVVLWADNPSLKLGMSTIPAANSDIAAWREHSMSFARIAAFVAGSADLAAFGDPERIGAARVTAGFFETLGVTPVAGRTFTAEEDRSGEPSVVMIGYGLWQRRFGGDTDLLGKTISVNGRGRTVVGILPQEFDFPRAAEWPSFFPVPERTELWLPLAFRVQDWQNRDERGLMTIARLKTGVSGEKAQAEMDAFAASRANDHPDTHKSWSLQVMPLRSQLVGKTQTALLILLSAVGLLLLIACVNVANLLLARAAARQKELAVRAALGASRLRLLRQLLTESLLLSGLGWLFGVALGSACLQLFLRLNPLSYSRLDDASVDLRVLAFTSLAGLCATVAFGLVPALQGIKLNLRDSLGTDGRGAGTIRQPVRGWLVGSQVALAIILLVGAGLMVRSFLRVQAVNPGFRAESVLAFGLQLPDAQYGDASRQSAFFSQLLPRLEAISGVRAAGAISFLPLSSGDNLGGFTVEGALPVRPGEEPSAERRWVTPGYFSAMGIPVRAGRVITATDSVGQPLVVVINETMARQFFDSKDPVGKRIRVLPSDSGPWRTVIGVVSDVRSSSLEAAPRPQVYIPHAQVSWGGMTVVVNTEGDPAGFITAVRSVVKALDPSLPATQMQTMKQVVSMATRVRRFNMAILVLFASAALVLTTIGIYGVVSYLVSRQRREIGIRLALGAGRADVLRLIFQQGMKPVYVGSVAGVAGSLLAARLIASQLYGISSTDPLTLTAIVMLLISVALLACWLPARRAAKVDPMVALRYE